MTDPTAALVQPHAAAIVEALTRTLQSPNGRTRLKAARLLLRWGEVPAGASPPGRLGVAEQQRMVEVLLRMEPVAKAPNLSATSCPVRHATGAAAAPPPERQEAANPAPKNTPLAEPALTPCPAATPVAPPAPAALPGVPPPEPGANPMSRERSPSPLAAPIGSDPPRRDGGPLSRPALPPRPSRADDPFYRRLPQPPPIEPPWPHGPDAWPAHRRKYWS